MKLRMYSYMAGTTDISKVIKMTLASNMRVINANIEKGSDRLRLAISGLAPYKIDQEGDIRVFRIVRNFDAVDYPGGIELSYINSLNIEGTTYHIFEILNPHLLKDETDISNNDPFS